MFFIIRIVFRFWTCSPGLIFHYFFNQMLFCFAYFNSVYIVYLELYNCWFFSLFHVVIEVIFVEFYLFFNFLLRLIHGPRCFFLYCSVCKKTNIWVFFRLFWLQMNFWWDVVRIIAGIEIRFFLGHFLFKTVQNKILT